MHDTELESLVRSIVERVVDDATGSAPSGNAPARTVALGSDHGGFPLKEQLKTHLSQAGWQVDDAGTHSTDSVDYPDFAIATAQRVAHGSARFGIMIDGAGIGSCMAANKVPGVRAALCYDLSTARNAREHNNANLLTLGAGLIGPALALQIADTFLATECTEPRHLKRVDKINALDAVRAGVA